METAVEQSSPAEIDRWLGSIVTGALTGAGDTDAKTSDIWTLLDTVPAAILMSLDRACSRMVGNTAAQTLFHVPAGQNLSQTAPVLDRPPFVVLVDGELAAADDLPMQKAARTGRPVPRSECEIRYDDGSHIFIAGHSIPTRNTAGEVCGSIGAFVEVTPQKLAHDEANMVGRELRHRLKNTISMIQAISRRTLRPYVPKEVYETFDGRLVAIADSQDLNQKSNWSGVLLSELIERSVRSVARNASGQVEAEGPEVPIPGTDALALNLILHEMATNACKYGALTRDEGTVPDRMGRRAWTCGARA